MSEQKEFKVKEKKPRTPQEKRLIKFGSVLLAVTVVMVTLTVLFNTNSAVFNKSILAVLPKSVYMEDVNMTFYIEENKNYDPKKDEPINAYTVYYYDQGGEGERIDLVDGMYNTSTKHILVLLKFYFEAKDKIVVLANIFKIITWVLGIAFVAFLIYAWYVNWCKRQDKLEAELKAAEQSRAQKEDI